MFYANIEAERVRNRMTKEDLSTSIGVTSKTYKAYVTGKSPIPSSVLIRLAALFHCSVDYLLEAQ